MKTYESCGMRVIISLIYFTSRHWFGECLRKNGCNFNILYSLLWILSIFHQPVTQHNFMNEFAFVHVFHCICGWRHLRKNVNLSSRYIEVVINIIILTTSKWNFSIQKKFYRRIFYDVYDSLCARVRTSLTLWSLKWWKWMLWHDKVLYIQCNINWSQANRKDKNKSKN